MDQLTIYRTLTIIFGAIVFAQFTWWIFKKVHEEDLARTNAVSPYNYNQAVAELIQQIWNLEMAFMRLNDESDNIHENSRVMPYIKMLTRIREELQRYEIMFNKTWKGQRMNPQEVHYILSKYALLQNVMDVVKQESPKHKLIKEAQNKLTFLKDYLLHPNEFEESLTYNPELDTEALYIPFNTPMVYNAQHESLRHLTLLALEEKLKNETEEDKPLTQRTIDILRIFHILSNDKILPNSGFVIHRDQDTQYSQPITLRIIEKSKLPAGRIQPTANRFFTLANGLKIEIELTYNP